MSAAYEMKSQEMEAMGDICWIKKQQFRDII
jgi:hypothetical protein